MTKMEDDQNGKRPKWKTTKTKDNHIGRRPHWKTTKTGRFYEEKQRKNKINSTNFIDPKFDLHRYSRYRQVKPRNPQEMLKLVPERIITFFNNGKLYLQDGGGVCLGCRGD